MGNKGTVPAPVSKQDAWLSGLVLGEKGRELWLGPADVQAVHNIKPA